MAIQFWENKERKILKKELFSNDAHDLAKGIFKEYQDSREKFNKPTQIRKFYDELLYLKEQIKEDKEKFSQYVPYVNLLKAKVAYAMARDLVGEKFKAFIDEGVGEAAKDLQEFKVLLQYFEAFLGYYKFFVEAAKDADHKTRELARR